MTIVCALHDRGAAWIGGDTRANRGTNALDFGHKWLLDPDGYWAIGCAGLPRGGYLAELNQLDMFGAGSAHEIAHIWREAVAEDGCATSRAACQANAFDINGIAASPDGIWLIGPDFTVLTVPNGRFCAEGTGAAYGYGAAHALGHPDVGGGRTPAESIIRTAIEAAIAHDSTCGGEVWLRKLEG